MRSQLLLRRSGVIAGAMSSSIVMVAIKLYLFDYVSQHHLVILAAALISLPCVAYCSRVQYAALYLYFLITVLAFHLGLVPVFLLSSDIELIRSSFNMHWYLNERGVIAAYFYVLIFLIGYALPLVWVRGPSLFVRGRAPDSMMNGDGRAIYVVSVAYLFGLILLWVVVIYGAGIRNYSDYIEGSQEAGASAYLGVLHASIGAAFCLAMISSGRKYIPLLLFSIWAVLAFLLGMRGNAAFPSLCVLALLASAGRLKVPLWLLVSGAVLFLLAASAVSVSRVGADADTIRQATSVSRGIAELGNSIRPVYEVVGWVEQGDSLRYGDSYLAPFERLFLRVFPIGTRVDGVSDSRLLNVLIMQRAGPYGFSVVAELLYNFGWLGCLLGGIAIASAMLGIGRSAMNGRLPLICVPIVFGLFTHVRQSFATSFGVALSVSIFSLLIVASSSIYTTHLRQSAFEGMNRR